MPWWADALVALSEAVRSALPALVTLWAAWLAWIAIHRVSRINAKRDAYASYVGAAEIYANDYRRWAEARRRGMQSVMLAPVKAQPVNEPLGSILLVAPPAISELVQEAQQALANLSGAVEAGSWNDALAAWQDVRKRLINRMRKDSGSDPLPDTFFADG